MGSVVTSANVITRSTRCFYLAYYTLVEGRLRLDEFTKLTSGIAALIAHLRTTEMIAEQRSLLRK